LRFIEKKCHRPADEPKDEVAAQWQVLFPSVVRLEEESFLQSDSIAGKLVAVRQWLAGLESLNFFLEVCTEEFPQSQQGFSWITDKIFIVYAVVVARAKTPI
jgi:hypothetical protein